MLASEGVWCVGVLSEGVGGWGATDMQQRQAAGDVLSSRQDRQNEAWELSLVLSADIIGNYITRCSVLFGAI